MASVAVSTPPPETVTKPPPSALPAPLTAAPDRPSLSTSDDGTSQRPRDARLIHLVLSSLGVHSYQERVPLQLLDFAYRYTSGFLSDSVRLSGEGYTSSGPTSKRAGNTSSTGGEGSNAFGGAGAGITVTALRQAIASRMDNVFNSTLPKEWMLEQAAERNRMLLPKIERGYGVQLPPERYVLTGSAWSMLDEWRRGEGESDDDDNDGGDDLESKEKVDGEVKNKEDEEDEEMGGMEDENGEGGFEDVFGEEENKE